MDAHLNLAFTLRAAPGTYALLVGAGVSASAQVPTAWDVQRLLLERLARAEGADPGDVFEWYAARHSRQPTYGGLLGELSQTSEERMSILRPFFEPTQDERENGIKIPTSAHRGIAELVAGGFIRIVLTTNFDRLIETAMRAAGIEPVVCSTTADVEGMIPLHAQDAVVIHLHGDYLYPRLLNTVGELASYATAVDVLLDQVFDEYGLVVAGWSARYDPALRDALARSKSRRYGAYWLEPHQLSEQAKQLIAARRAVVVSTEAEHFFPQTADAVRALEQRDEPHPATVDVAVATAKRWLAGTGTAIPLHDLLAKELEKARALISGTSHVGFETDDHRAEYSQALGRIESRNRVFLALVASTIYWGDSRTDPWWLVGFEELSPYRRHAGSVDLINLQRVPAIFLFYAAGIAAVGARRHDVVAKLFLQTTIPAPYREERRAAPDALIPHGTVSVEHPSRWMFHSLRPLFDLVLGGGDGFRRAWELWEYTLLAYFAWRSPRSSLKFWPYIRADSIGDSYPPACALRVREEYERLEQNHPLLRAGVFDGRLQVASAAFDSVDAAFHAEADRYAWRSLPPGGGELPSGIHYPGLPGDPP